MNVLNFLTSLVSLLIAYIILTVLAVVALWALALWFGCDTPVHFSLGATFLGWCGYALYRTRRALDSL